MKITLITSITKLLQNFKKIDPLIYSLSQITLLSFNDSTFFSVFRKKLLHVRSSHLRCSRKKILLKILQNSQETTCAGVSFLMQMQITLLKKRLRHWCFAVNFRKF